MANLRPRKILAVGDSLAVALPPDWLRGKGLKRGDEVEVLYNGEVRVRVPQARPGVAAAAAGVPP